MDNSRRLCGDEWQSWANQLLLRHYGPENYQKVPDQYKGDAGLEGYVLSMGLAYQMYGPEEPISIVERSQRHKIKVTNDIRKFIEKKALLVKVLGPVKICRWILLVPVFDNKDTLIHANKKAEEVRRACLPYVSEGFQIVIQDEDAFQVERDAILKTKTNGISISSEEINLQSVKDWTNTNPPLVRTIDEKLSRYPKIFTPEQLINFRTEIIKAYLFGQNVLDDLRKYPSIYDEISNIKSQKERYLILESLTRSGIAGDLFTKYVHDFENEMKNHLSEVEDKTIENIAFGTIADWLIRCPLDF